MRSDGNAFDALQQRNYKSTACEYGSYITATIVFFVACLLIAVYVKPSNGDGYFGVMIVLGVTGLFSPEKWRQKKTKDGNYRVLYPWYFIEDVATTSFIWFLVIAFTQVLLDKCVEACPGEGDDHLFLLYTAAIALVPGLLARLFAPLRRFMWVVPIQIVIFYGIFNLFGDSVPGYAKAVLMFSVPVIIVSVAMFKCASSTIDEAAGEGASKKATATQTFFFRMHRLVCESVCVVFGAFFLIDGRATGRTFPEHYVFAGISTYWKPIVGVAAVSISFYVGYSLLETCISGVVEKGDGLTAAIVHAVSQVTASDSDGGPAVVVIRRDETGARAVGGGPNIKAGGGTAPKTDVVSAVRYSSVRRGETHQYPSDAFPDSSSTV
jgi:hypothetical protein